MDCGPPGSSVHRILQARTLEWAAISFSRGSSWPRDQTWASCITGRFFTFWAPMVATLLLSNIYILMTTDKYLMCFEKRWGFFRISKLKISFHYSSNMAVNIFFLFQGYLVWVKDSRLCLPHLFLIILWCDGNRREQVYMAVTTLSYTVTDNMNMSNWLSGPMQNSTEYLLTPKSPLQEVWGFCLRIRILGS